MTHVVFALALGLLATGSQAVGQASQVEQEAWALLKPLVGRWEGAIDGRLGTGRGIRDYEMILDEKFLVGRQASVRLPQEQSPVGDYHREMAVFSFDKSRDVLMLREFFVEGVVSRYSCEVTRRRIVCLTEHVENGDGLRARLTLDIRDAYRFEEIFELAPAGQDFTVYFTNTWTRAPVIR